MAVKDSSALVPNLRARVEKTRLRHAGSVRHPALFGMSKGILRRFDIDMLGSGTCDIAVYLVAYLGRKFLEGEGTVESINVSCDGEFLMP